MRARQLTLPPVETDHWVKARKAAVIAAIDAGELTDAQACAMYDLSLDELQSWRWMIRRHGAEALRVTALQRYRRRDMDQASREIVA